MIKLKLIFASVSLLAFSCIADVPNKENKSEPQVVATYEGIKVTDADVSQEFKNQLESQKQIFEKLNQSTKEILVKSYIDYKLIDKEITTSGFEKTPEFVAKHEELKKGLLRQEFLTNYANQNVTEAKFEEAYKKYVAETEGKNQFKISHILVANEEEAKKIKAEYNKKNNNFQSLAKKYSIDKGTALAIDENKKPAAGLLGYFIEGQLPAEFEKVFAMKSGEVSAPIKSNSGWHLFRVDLIRKAVVVNKDDAKMSLTTLLKNQAVESYLKDLNTKAKTEITVK